MVETYGQLLCAARKQHSPPLTAKELAEALNVKPPFITDIEKGRRLPSLETQMRIKEILACETYPALCFDDLAASSNPDCRIVAEDLSRELRCNAALRELIRTISMHGLSKKEIETITANIGGNSNDAK